MKIHPLTLKSKWLGFPLIAFTLTACTFGVPINRDGGADQAQPPRASKSKKPSSYIVRGRRYHVLDSAQGFIQRGTASWYGKKFHGRKTANGEIYNMYAMTAAHKTLPLPTLLKVENLSNGRTLIVKVNDRGPFIEDRIIDLSFAAAQQLGFAKQGTVKVEISALRARYPEPPREVVRSIALKDDFDDAPLFIQTGSFNDKKNALRLLRRLQDAQEENVKMSRLKTQKGLFYRVRIGPLYDIDAANQVVVRLHQKGFRTTRIVIQD